MKNKILLILGISVLVIALTTAGIISNLNKDLSLTSEQKTALETLSLTSYNIVDSNIGTSQIERCLKKDGAINACKRFPTSYENCSKYNLTIIDENSTEQERGDCIEYKTIYYTEEELIKTLDDWEMQRIELIANVTIQRQSRTKEIIREGITTIK